MSILFAVAATIFGLAAITSVAIGWFAGMKGPASFLTLIWLAAAVFGMLWLSIVPAGHDGVVWIGLLCIFLGGLTVIWAPYGLRRHT